MCSKLKAAPDGFALAGEINGTTVCFKIGPIAHRPPPSIPTDQQTAINELENNLYYMNIRNGSKNLSDNGKADNASNNNDYELLQGSYRLSPPKRIAPKAPNNSFTGKIMFILLDFAMEMIECSSRLQETQINILELWVHTLKWMVFHLYLIQLYQTIKQWHSMYVLFQFATIFISNSHNSLIFSFFCRHHNSILL